jgi:hypothetical protein
MPRLWKPWPMRMCARGSPISGSRFFPVTSDARSAWRASESRDREMVADYQIGKH